MKAKLFTLLAGCLFLTPLIADEKIDKWNAVATMVYSLEDNSQIPVDESLQDLLVGMNVYDIKAVFFSNGYASEEEHSKEFSSPYIITDRFLDIEQSQKKAWFIKSCLDSFYALHKCSNENMLTLDLFHMSFGLMNRGGEFQILRSKAEQEVKLAEYKSEMRAFGKYLKDKFFEGDE